jgi:thiamine-monophosphate kinase
MRARGGRAAPPRRREAENAPVGEFDLLARLRERLSPPAGHLLLGAGDDAAISVPEGATATSVDALVDGVHFRREWTPPAAIGHKAVAAALSDLAAMGAAPGEAYVVLGVPPDLDEDGCLELLGGAERVARQTGTQLAGGDVTRSPVLWVSVTVVGHERGPERLVTRAGAGPGDLLVLSGELGGAAAGLLLLEEPALPADLENAVAEALRRRQLEPWPRLAEGRELARSARAMIDISDGLAADAAHLAAASGVRLEIDAAALPVAEGVATVAAAAGRDPLELAAAGGEDYELLAALPAGSLAADGFTIVGTVAEGEGAEVRLPGGRSLAAPGFDQLR